MTENDMQHEIHVLIAAETDEALILDSTAEENTIIFTTKHKETFKVTIEKL